MIQNHFQKIIMKIRKCIPPFLSIVVFLGHPLYASEEKDGHPELFDMNLETLLMVKVGPSADASEEGLSEVHVGGQIAKGGRLGFLGSKNVMNTPFSTINYTQEFVQNQHAASIGDVLQYDPSVRIARGFGNFQQAYIIRGLPIFSDDMLYNGLYGMLPRQYLSAELIERVEVFRGVNTFLNGAAPSVSGGLGGVVNVMPKRAPKYALTELTLGVESDMQTLAAFDMGRRFDDDRFGARVNVVNRSGDTAVEGESRDLRMATVGTDFRGKRIRVSVDFGFQEHRIKAATPSITIGSGLAIPEAPKAESKIAQSWTYSDEKDIFGTLRAEFDASDHMTLWLAGGLREGDEDSIYTVAVTVNSPDGEFTSNQFNVVHKDSVSIGEIGLRWKGDTESTQHKISLSANRYRNSSRNAYEYYAATTNNLYRVAELEISTSNDLEFSSGQMSNPLVTERREYTSFSVADEIALLEESVLVTLGARYQQMKMSTYNYDSGQEESDYNEGLVSPSVGIVYKFTANYSVYANYIEGVLKGDTVPSINNNNGEAVPNGGKVLQPYQSKQAELGLKYDKGPMGAMLGVYGISKPAPGFDPDNTFTITDRTDYSGVELSLYGEVKSGLKVLGGASILKSEDSGHRVLGVPEQLLNLGLEWDVSALSGLTLIANYMYTGFQFADVENTQRVPSWDRMDIGARYMMNISSSKQCVIRMRVENISNSNYWASVGGYPGAGYLVLGSPRTFYLNASIQF